MAQGASAQLSGQVVGKAGESLAGATVAIRNTETGFVRTVTTDVNGRYIAVLLPVGPYQLTVTKAGYLTASNVKINLNLGDAAPLNVKLAPEAGAVVEVVAQSAALDTERSSAATSVSPDAITNLPVKGRSFLDFATLTPNVTIDSNRGNLAIGGQRGINTAINIDGGDYNEPFFGGVAGSAESKAPFTLSIEAIKEFQVITNGASAEFGRMGGGMLNAITKNGTNELTGSLFFFERPKALVAKDHQTRLDVADFKNQQYGFSVGGPIIKDKLHYFVAFDGQRQTNPVNFAWGGTAPPAGLLPLSASVPADAALINRDGTYSTKADSSTVFLRFDWNINTDHNLQFRYNQLDFKGNVNTGILFAKEAVSTDDTKVNSFVGQWNWTLGANWINEFRVNYVKESLPRVPTTTNPSVSISSVGTYGSGTNFSRDFDTKRTQVIETLTYVTPDLQVKGGLDYNKTDVSEVFASTQYGSYSFNNITDFRAGNWNSFQQRFSLIPGQTARDSGTFAAVEKELALFVQADWKFSQALKFGLGLRLDRQEHADFPVLNPNNPTAVPASATNPNGSTLGVNAKIPTDTQFSPRLSMTWVPEADSGRTVVRANVGRYVSRTPSVFLFQAYAENGIRAARITFGGNATTAAADALKYGIPRGSTFNADNPYRMAGLPTGVALPALDVFSFSPDFKNPYTDSFNLALERTYGAWVLGLSGVYSKTEQLERLRDTNLAAPTVSAQGREVFPAATAGGSNNRPNTNYRWIALYTSDVAARYNALTLSAKYQKSDSPFTAQFFYTFSQNRDSDSNERNFSSWSTQNTQKLQDDWSWADTDRRHMLTGYFSYLEKRWTGIQFGVSLRYLSGTPYSETNSNDLNNDGVGGNDRLVGTFRNQFRTASVTTLDLKISRDWLLWARARISVSAEIYNLLNRLDSYQRVRFQGTDAAPVLSTANTAISNPRQVQLGARIAF